jgi:UDP-GlcNAc:undecaprenyl-phosphate/decaprenyl-phosphate GlcNAc-1-phosphate transferase
LLVSPLASDKKALAPLVVAGLLIAAIFGATQIPLDPHYYAHVVVRTQNNLKLEFLYQSRPKAEDCLAAAATIADAIRTTCPGCQITTQQCPSKLDPELGKLLSDEPVAFPVSRLPKGVVAYRSTDSKLALAACREAERQSGSKDQSRATCYPPDTARPQPGLPGPQPLGGLQTVFSILILMLSGLTSAFTGYLIVRYEALHARWSLDDTRAGPQKFHAKPTPRIGGIGLAAGLSVAGAALLAIEHAPGQDQFGYLLLASIPAFLGGITEDVTKHVQVRTRLMLTMLAAACAAWLLGAVLPRVDIPGVDTLLRWTPFAVVFTVFAVSGVANAINIIDGYNGLAGGYAAIALAALAWVSLQVGDGFILTAALAMIGALLGFLVWNYPSGKIFLGDGGAYLLGFWLAELSVLLVARHAEVSPWFPLLLLVYPIFETLFSIYRRKLKRGLSAGRADRLHMHQVIYMRLVRVFVGTTDPALLTRRNSMVANYFWLLGMLCCVPAILFWDNTALLVAASLVVCVGYVILYRQILRWKAPTMLKRRRA